MSHEVSDTIQRPQGWANVYGGTQFPLPQTFGFEKKGYYPSLDNAVNAAQWRSRMGGGPEDAYANAPHYGFSERGNLASPQPQPQTLPPSQMLAPAEMIQRMNMLLDMRRGR